MPGPLAVLPALQGRGVGGALLDYAEAKADIAELTIVSCRRDIARLSLVKLLHFCALIGQSVEIFSWCCYAIKNFHGFHAREESIRGAL